jgi:hypothetical protein
MAPEVNIDGAHLCCGELAGYLDFNLNGHIHTTFYDFRIIFDAQSSAPAFSLRMENTLLEQSYFYTKGCIH